MKVDLKTMKLDRYKKALHLGKEILLMTEIIFIVEESPEGGYEAKALDHSIFTEAETLEDLKQNVKEAIHCHFEVNAPKMVRLHFVKEEVFAA